MEYANKKRTQGLYDPAYEHDSCGVGFVCDIKGRPSHDIVKYGLQVLKRLAHRGAVGSDPKTGDGAGILIQIPHAFYQRSVTFKLPQPEAYGTGLVFLPKNEKDNEAAKRSIRNIVEREGQVLLGWRKVPTDDSAIGVTARKICPIIEQVFISKGQKIRSPIELQRKLYVIRRRIEKEVSFPQFYITGLSTRTIIYKGLLMPDQVEEFYPELKDQSIGSSIALVHSRYSTNTFPAWELAQPFRYLAHNGEINTIRGNINWMAAKESSLQSKCFNDDLNKLKPIIVPGGSDSASLDNAFELLCLSGRTLPEVMMMLIPSAWEHNDQIDINLKDYYRYQASLMEPWDGPAAVAFTDGKSVGAVLDRNGLRPARYIITKNNLVVMASEVGVLDIDPTDIILSGKLEPGKMFYIDTEKGGIIDDEEIKRGISRQKPYGKWIKDNTIDIDSLPRLGVTEKLSEDINVSLKAFGYTREDLKMIIKPMAETGKEPIGSMGNDTPYAVLSLKPQPLFNYFKQLFAQVTNPPIDPIREEIVMSLESYVGPQKNILEETAEHCRRLKVKEPVLTNEKLERIRTIIAKGFKTKTIFINLGKEEGLKNAIDRICAETVGAIEQGFSFVILSDRKYDREHCAVPSLMAVGAVHHHLIRKTMRSRIGIIVESAEPREVHHFALLLGYGADLINPYLAYEAIGHLIDEKQLNLDIVSATGNYLKAVNKGILKILSKMGISTLYSYRGAQIFEALGLDNDVVERYFTGTSSRIGGADINTIEKETRMRHEGAYRQPESGLLSGGIYQWRRDGETHLWNPESIYTLQDAVRKNDEKRYKEFSALINDQSRSPVTLRSLFKFKKCEPVPIDQVEPKEKIFKRFATGAMSFGSISKGAHETIAIAMNRIGGRSNTGEGGESPDRFIRLKNGDSLRSAIKQVASGRFGVTTNYLVNADELQIKIAQGAKPGEGGQLPGYKVSAVIAKTRYTTPGVTLISPPPHHDIYSIEDLAQLIFDLKNVNPKARISVKLVSEVGVGTVAAGVAKGHADMILIAGGDGGTGASPLSSIKHAGLPWEMGLSETHQTLVLNDLRSRVRLQADGQMRTGRDIAIAAILGAEEFGFATIMLIILGCVMLRHCHLNNCSVGVATQDEYLSSKFSGKPEYIINYFRFVADELRGIMANLGVRSIDELVGRTELLEMNGEILPWKAKNIDFSKILYKPDVEKSVGTRCTIAQDHNIDKVLDRRLIELAQPAINEAKKVDQEVRINNSDRSTGAMLSGELILKRGEQALPEGTIRFKFNGIAGQSFGAFLAKGITFELEGLANDYVGKGISGGKIIIYPNKRSEYKPEENIIIGNTTFYGAIAGEAYIRGRAGERFLIRNSGLYAVVEGVGDHGCEYMTGGRALILGPTGRNFGAGMSGGIVYVLDRNGDFREKCNTSMIELQEHLTDEDKGTIKALLANHYAYTGSQIAKKMLDDFNNQSRKIIKVMPIEYKRLLEERAMKQEELELMEVSDG